MLTDDKLLTLPCGRPFHMDRLRSDGILGADELEFCKTHGIPLAFDPMQCGWVLAQGIDDLFPNEVIDPAHPRTGRAQTNVSLHVHLRPWDMKDAPRLVELLDDPKMWETLPEPYPGAVTLEMAQSLIEIANHGGHHSVFAILYDDVPVGQVRLHSLDSAQEDGVSELSYWIGRAYWRQGFASAAVVPFVRQCFAEDATLAALIAKVKDGNVASRRVLEAAGFVPNGCADPGWDLFRRTR